MAITTWMITTLRKKDKDEAFGNSVDGSAPEYAGTSQLLFRTRATICISLRKASAVSHIVVITLWQLARTKAKNNYVLAYVQNCMQTFGRS
jgi:hypothetical protein